MNTHQFEIAESDRVRLRAVVATIDRELSGLSREASAGEHRRSERVLMASWRQLVELLALGAPPEIRECPVCQHVCMRAATLCGQCWTKLAPLPPAVAAVATAPVAAPRVS